MPSLQRRGLRVPARTSALVVPADAGLRARESHPPPTLPFAARKGGGPCTGATDLLHPAKELLERRLVAAERVAVDEALDPRQVRAVRVLPHVPVVRVG